MKRGRGDFTRPLLFSCRLTWKKGSQPDKMILFPWRKAIAGVASLSFRAFYFREFCLLGGRGVLFGDGVVCVRFPSRLIVFCGLIPPHGPPLTLPPCEEFKVGPG